MATKSCSCYSAVSLEHTNCHGYKLFKYQGCWYYYNTLQGVLNFQRDFQPQDTDIILASLPKSGTTWLKALTFALFQRSKHLSDDHHHPLLSHNPHELVPFLEFEFLQSSSPDLTKHSSSPRLLSTHMPLHTLQKDVLVSYWFFANSNTNGVERSSKSENMNGVEDCSTFEAMFESFCNGVSFCGSFWENVLS
ncbi:unnamed protein product [Arabis nemorensis]|uniref:Sulfotransferase n=1 Tax=Arabis nemorensis TaxID=586526 RepID=A0A565AQ84_9BRAS|nr:unnamed protein product [Arabis nemorensis]